MLDDPRRGVIFVINPMSDPQPLTDPWIADSAQNLAFSPDILHTATPHSQGRPAFTLFAAPSLKRSPLPSRDGIFREA